HEAERISYLCGRSLALENQSQNPLRTLEVALIHLQLRELVPGRSPAVPCRKALLEQAPRLRTLPGEAQRDSEVDHQRGLVRLVRERPAGPPGGLRLLA